MLSCFKVLSRSREGARTDLLNITKRQHACTNLGTHPAQPSDILPNPSVVSLALLPLRSSSRSALPLMTIPSAGFPPRKPPGPRPAELESDDATGDPARERMPLEMVLKNEWCGPSVGEGIAIGSVCDGGRVREVGGGGFGSERIGEPPDAGETARRLNACA